VEANSSLTEFADANKLREVMYLRENCKIVKGHPTGV